MGTMIEIRGLSKHFGPLKAVDNISFSVGRGEVLGFLGPNGAGKSTTMKMIAGFVTPTDGKISVCGHDVASEPVAAKSRIGYLAEGAPAYGDMTPRSFFDFVGEIRGFSRAERDRRIAEVVRRVHLESVVHQPIETLSKGFKRRVGLAQAILHDPDVLILDEPNDGLDPNQKHEVRALIREMAPEKAIVLSTHILGEVEAVCTRAIIIDKGRVVFDGTPTELEARAPSSVEKNRLDWIFRSLTSTEAPIDDSHRTPQPTQASAEEAQPEKETANTGGGEL
jgi:ABC-2 type transport system ATP-binding protein